MRNNYVCDGCRNAANVLWWFRGYHLCRHCRAIIEGEIPDRLTIPAGCEMRLMWMWWMRLTGRISEGMADQSA